MSPVLPTLQLVASIEGFLGALPHAPAEERGDALDLLLRMAQTFPEKSPRARAYRALASEIALLQKRSPK